MDFWLFGLYLRLVGFGHSCCGCQCGCFDLLCRAEEMALAAAHKGLFK